MNFVQFLRSVVALLHVCSPILNWCLAHFPPSVGAVIRVVAGHSAPRPAQLPAPGLIAGGARRAARRHPWWKDPVREAVRAVRARRALEVLQGPARRPAAVRGMHRARCSSPCRPATTWARPTTSPPLDRVTLAPTQPDPAWTQKVPPRPDGGQRHLSAVWDMVLESRGL